MKDKPIRLLLWGGRFYFRRMLPILREREKNGEISIVGIVDKQRPESGEMEGIPYISPADVPKQDYDYLQILPLTSRDSIREDYLKLPGSDRKKVIEQMYPEIGISQYLRLAESRPTIFSRICWGGMVYDFLGMECLSPFKKLWLRQRDYLRFLHDPRGYIAEDPVPDHMEQALPGDKPDLYPVLRLGDIYIHCSHTEQMDQALADWFRRREKINWNFTVAMLWTLDPKVEHEFLSLDTVHRKICFVPYQSTEPFSFTIRLEKEPGSPREMIPEIMSTGVPFRNPYDMYSMFFGNLKDNAYYDPQQPITI